MREMRTRKRRGLGDRSWQHQLMTDHTPSKNEVIEYHAAGKALTQGAQHSAPAYDKSKVFGRATSSGAAFLRDGRAFWVAPKAPGASAAANSAPGRRYPNLNFRWALSEIQIGPV